MRAAHLTCVRAVAVAVAVAVGSILQRSVMGIVSYPQHRNSTAVEHCIHAVGTMVGGNHTYLHDFTPGYPPRNWLCRPTKTGYFECVECQLPTLKPARPNYNQ